MWLKREKQLLKFKRVLLDSDNGNKLQNVTQTRNP